MRLLVEIDYYEGLLTGEISDNEALVLLRALDKAFFVKIDRFNDDKQLEVQPKNLNIRVLTTNSPRLPTFGLREIAKTTLAEAAAEESVPGFEPVP